MSSLSQSFRILAPQWRHRSLRFLILRRSRRAINGGLAPRLTSLSKNDDSVSPPKPTQLGYEPLEELFGLEVNSKSNQRNARFGLDKPRSCFGPNGRYSRELPCPTCRGRGYTPCLDCGVERSRPDCSNCKGKGIMTCRQCVGECVIWEESIDEQPWERACSISPLKVKEDDEVDNLEIKLDKTKKSKPISISRSRIKDQSVSKKSQCQNWFV